MGELAKVYGRIPNDAKLQGLCAISRLTPDSVLWSKKYSERLRKEARDKKIANLVEETFKVANDIRKAFKAPPPEPALPNPPTETKKAAVTGETPKLIDTLPDGWTERESETDGGKRYYCHAATGTTTWKKPA